MNYSRKRKTSILLILLILFLFACSENPREPDDNEINDLEIHAINVGQGDCTLIIAPNGKALLIDGGNNHKGNNEVVPYLQFQGIDSLAYIIATHMDADHIGGIDEVLESIPVSRHVFDHGIAPSGTPTQSYYDYMAAAGDKYMPIHQGEGHLIALDNRITFECVASGGNGLDIDNENDNSVSVIVKYGDFEYFIGGDLSGNDEGNHTDMETHIKDDIGQVEGFKVNHHGSSSSSNTGFIETLDAQFAVISCGSNGYGHPDASVVDRLQTAGIFLYQTASSDGDPIDNDILISTDGLDIIVQTSHSADNYTCR